MFIVSVQSVDMRPMDRSRYVYWVNSFYYKLLAVCSRKLPVFMQHGFMAAQ